MRFEVLTAVIKKSASFWNVMQCRLIKVYQRF
jgi:hypothetical protein